MRLPLHQQAADELGSNLLCLGSGAGGSGVGVVGVGRGRQKKAVGEVLGVPMRERTDTIQLPTQ